MITYAQNFEDVMLARLFDGQSHGFYVDVGAHHPSELSVTKHFYDLGWSGLNIEPVRSKWALFTEQRSRDINLNIAVGRAAGRRKLYYVEGNDALSTLSDGQAAVLSNQGYAISQSFCPVLSLSAILAQYAPSEIDFLKIDTEGLEEEVLASLDLAAHRPAVLLIESVSDQSGFSGWATFDLERALRAPAWESSIAQAGYRFAHFDGLNRFYVRNDRAHLADRLRVPPSVFDFVLRDSVAEAIRPMVEKELVIQHLASELKAKDALLERLLGPENNANSIKLKSTGDVQGVRVLTAKVGKMLKRFGGLSSR